MIKVLHLIPTLTSGGAERQLVNLVSSTKGINHVVCVLREPEFFAPEIQKAGYPVIDLNVPGKHPFFRAAWQFRKAIAGIQPDIIHSWLYDANISARLATFFNRKTPIVTSFQLADYEPDLIRNCNWNRLKVRGLRYIDKLTSITTRSYFVPCSQFVKKSYETHYGINESRTRVIYNSVNPDLMRANGKNLKTALNLPSDAFIYLNVGRLDPQKNQKALLEAFQGVAAEVPNAFLLLVGVGYLENALKELANELRIADRVFFLGRRNDVGALMELADVFVFPSLMEGLPVALIEAMFKRLPCIASTIEVFKEVVIDRETGLLINPFTPDELKNAMIALHKSAELRTSLGENAFRQANARFHTNVTARQWEEFYQRVLQ